MTKMKELDASLNCGINDDGICDLNLEILYTYCNNITNNKFYKKSDHYQIKNFILCFVST